MSQDELLEEIDPDLKASDIPSLDGESFEELDIDDVKDEELIYIDDKENADWLISLRDRKVTSTARHGKRVITYEDGKIIDVEEIE